MSDVYRKKIAFYQPVCYTLIQVILINDCKVLKKYYWTERKNGWKNFKQKKNGNEDKYTAIWYLW